ncbi:MAG: diaminopimelate epimerase [Chiayiivirga sp.]|jgi:diaminopimelate epimerase|uniref:diaminopimelate epimerase n=1 Tax=Chiayiivirga sp. TaxID=2041042 RepID=UPI0025B8EC8A|nr:diaminopimelate epimerase [Chiayiivirga sp.]MCI1710935.1 diaminopimelate epimerase [Chiayiivirga sp.]MCI1728271.1 diaminopimelate epimerase [Chiayiivirga sp.]
MSTAAGLRFSKMHGAGNDFVILDRRREAKPLDAALVARLTDRHRGIGCDQLLTIEAPRSANAVAAYGIWNSDGSASSQCGNGARCIAAWLWRDGLADRRFVLDSPSGPVEAELAADGRVSIDMGIPDFSPAGIGLDLPQAMDGYSLVVASEALRFGAVSMGNPHAVLEVDSVEGADVARLGPALQQHPAFTRSCNVGFAQVLSPQRIRLRVHERGAGETLACGSGACAAVAVLRRRDRVGPEVEVQLPGGVLQISWPGAGHPLRMKGPAEFVFEGELLG